MGKDLSKVSHCMLFCNGGSCKRKGAEHITDEIRAYMKSEGLYSSVHTVKTMCNGRCEDAPTMIVMPENTWYKNLTVAKAIEIVGKHIKQGKPVKKYTLYEEGMDYVASDNPLKPTAPDEFSEVFDEEFGEVIMAKANPKEQNLYPLLKDVFQKFLLDLKIRIPELGAEYFEFNIPVDFNYEDKWVSISKYKFNAEFAIGVPSKDAPKAYKDARIRHVEIFKTLDGRCHVLRLKSQDGTVKLIAKDKTTDHKVWNHFVNIYLERPQIEAIK